MRNRIFTLMMVGAMLMVAGLIMSFTGCSLSKAQRVELGVSGITALCGMVQGNPERVINAAGDGIALFLGEDRHKFEAECAAASPATMIMEYTELNRPALDDKIISMRVFGNDRIELCIEVADIVESLCEAGTIDDDRCVD